MSGRLKGQFFMLGALLLCAVFFAALPAGTILTGGYTEDISRLAENLEGEIPHALNLAMLEDSSPDKLGDFTGFVRDNVREHYLELESLWVVTFPDQENPGEVEVYAGNWLGRPVSVYVTIEGEEERIVVNSGEIEKENFHSVGSDFTLEVSFEERSWSGQVARDKANLYSYMRLSRGENSIVKEVAG